MPIAMTFNNKAMTFGSTQKWLSIYESTNPLNLPAYTMRFQFDNLQYDPSVDNNSQLWVRVSSDPNVWDYTYSSKNWQYRFDNKFPTLTGYMHLLGANSTGVTNMEGLFINQTALRTVCLFDTSAVTNMRSMFSGCRYLLTVPAYNTSNVTNLHGFCGSCERLESLPMLDTSRVTYWQFAFNGCRIVPYIPLYNTSSALDMSFTFAECPSVRSGALAIYQQASTQAHVPSHSNTFLYCGNGTDTGRAELAQIPTSWGGTA